MGGKILYLITIGIFFLTNLGAILSLRKYFENGVSDLFARKRPHKIHPMMDRMRKTYLSGYLLISGLIVLATSDYISQLYSKTNWSIPDYTAVFTLLIFCSLGILILWYCNSKFGVRHFMVGVRRNKDAIMASRDEKQRVPTYVRTYSLPHYMSLVDDSTIKELYQKANIFPDDFNTLKDILSGTYAGKKWEINFWKGDYYRNNSLAQQKFVNLIFDFYTIDFKSMSEDEVSWKPIKEHFKRVIESFDVYVNQDCIKSSFDQRKSYFKVKQQ